MSETALITTLLKANEKHLKHQMVCEISGFDYNTKHAYITWRG